jgi:hypothetical protein
MSWRVVSKLLAKPDPQPEDSGPVDAIVRLLRSERQNPLECGHSSSHVQATRVHLPEAQAVAKTRALGDEVAPDRNAGR